MTTSKQHRIQHCRICDAADLQTVILLPQMPLTDEFVSVENIGHEFMADIEIAVCKQCGCSQNLHNTDMDDYYHEYTYSVQSSGFAIQFMRTLAERVKAKYFSTMAAPKVIEIGSGTGEQLLEFKKLGFEVLGIEPSGKLVDYANNNGIPTLQAFFDEHIGALLPENFQSADLIISSYTFDHIPQPVAVLQKIHAILSEGGVMLHEVHDLGLIKQRNEYCLFEHEHYTYLNDRTMAYVLGANGFKVDTFDLLTQAEKRANSLLVAARKSKAIDNYPVNVAFELNELQQLNQNVNGSIARIQAWLAENSNSTIVAYGAGGRGIMTIAALPDVSGIKFMVDKNPKAPNIFAPKAHLPVYGIDALEHKRADKILVFSFGYFNEIVSELGEKFGYRPEQFFSVLDLLEQKNA
jgi:SAM-dependent methyltransferase